jgi:hypothetical protein
LNVVSFDALSGFGERHVASVDEPLAWSNSAQSREVGSSAALQANCGLSDANASLYGILITLWEDQEMGRGILLWLLGVPIPIIILLALLWH